MALVRVYCGLASADLRHVQAGQEVWLTVAVVDDAGRLLEICQVTDDSQGYAELSGLLAPRADGQSSVAVATDTDRHCVARLLSAAGRPLAVAEGEAADDYAERFSDDTSAAETQASPAQRRAIGLARALQAGVLSAAPQTPPEDLLVLKPVLSAHAAMVAGRQQAAAALREILRELHPATLRAFPDPAEPIPLAVLDALPEAGMLGGSGPSARSRDAQITADLTATGISDSATIAESITALRVAVAETPRRPGANRAWTAAVAETVRQAVASVRACDTAAAVLVKVLTERVEHGRSRSEAPSNGASLRSVPSPAPVKPAGIDPAQDPGTKGDQVDPAFAGARRQRRLAEPPAAESPARSPRPNGHSGPAQPSMPAASAAPAAPARGNRVKPDNVVATSTPTPAAAPGGPETDGRMPTRSGLAGRFARRSTDKPDGPPAAEPRPAQTEPGRGPNESRHAVRAAESAPPAAMSSLPPSATMPPMPTMPTMQPMPGMARSSAMDEDRSLYDDPTFATDPLGIGTGEQSAVPDVPRPREGRVTPPWQAADLPAEPPSLRLVEAARSGMPGRGPAAGPMAGPMAGGPGTRPMAGPVTGSQTGLQHTLPTDPPALRLVESTGQFPTSTRRPPSTLPVASDGDKDKDLLIFAAAKSAWFLDDQDDPAEERSWASSLVDAGWRAAEMASQPKVGADTTTGLPKRVPQQNLVPGSVNGPVERERPLRIVRDAAAIAAHTTGYFQGSRRGQEVGGYSVGGRPGREAAGGWDFTRDPGPSAPVAQERGFEYRSARR